MSDYELELRKLQSLASLLKTINEELNIRTVFILNENGEVKAQKVSFGDPARSSELRQSKEGGKNVRREEKK